MIHLTLPTVVSSVVVLLIRLVVGFSFVIASRNKSKNIKKFAKNNGLPVLVAIFLTIAEMVGGIALIIGLLSQFAALGLMLLMLGTIRLHIFVWKSPYWAAKGGWEYDLMLFTMASVILTYGGGRFVI